MSWILELARIVLLSLDKLLSGQHRHQIILGTQETNGQYFVRKLVAMNLILRLGRIMGGLEI